MKAILDNKHNVWIQKIGRPYSLIIQNNIRRSVNSNRLVIIEDDPKVDGIGIVLYLTFGVVIGLGIVFL